jgi:anti-anti-sigma factor
MDFIHNFAPTGALIIQLQGEMDAQGCTKLRPALDQLAAEHAHNKVVLDLSEVGFLDSSGVGVIVFLFKRLKNAGGDLSIANVHGQPRELMKLLRIDSAIPVDWKVHPDRPREGV